MFFNTRGNDEEMALDQLEERAISRASAPGQQSFGSGASGMGGVVTNLVIAPPTTNGGDEIGVTEDGVFYFPFRLGIDWVGRPGAWLQPLGAKYDFGN